LLLEKKGTVLASSTVENYLKQLYLEQRAANGSRVIPTGRLAAAMGVVPGTATSMVKALAASGLVEYESRAGVRLTSRGEQLALHVLRRHRLVELFLVKILGLDWSVVHEEADALEHAVSDRVIDSIDALLGHPTADPHGDPIPSGKGLVDDTPRPSLADCPLNKSQRVIRVLGQDPEFLRFIERQGLTPGATVTVASRETASQAVEIRVAKRPLASLGLVAAEKILVEPIQDASKVPRK
jgi:DtxR family transcriptional regulator, Mn-dependent transcriptional regulator